MQLALRELHARGAGPPLVLCGHMHSLLKGSGRRDMALVDPASGTVFVNSAVVPRIKEFDEPAPTVGVAAAAGDGAAACTAGPAPAEESDDAGPAAAGNGGGSPAAPAAESGQQEGPAQLQRVRGHHFVVVTLSEGAVASAANVWVGVTPGSSAGGGSHCFPLREEPLVEAVTWAHGNDGSGGSAGGRAYRVFQGSTGSWVTVTCAERAGAAAPAPG